MGTLDTWLLLGIAACNAFAAYWAFKAREMVIAASANIQKIETATNSMKDALVKATGDAALAKGTAEGLKQGREETR